jgi:hypothetical protein
MAMDENVFFIVESELHNFFNMELLRCPNRIDGDVTESLNHVIFVTEWDFGFSGSNGKDRREIFVEGLRFSKISHGW